MDWLGTIFFAVLVMTFQMAMHELGHYLIAYKFGWKPKLTLVKYGGWMPAIAVKTKDVDLEINNTEDFLKWYIDLTRFSTGGLLFSLLAVILLEAFNLISIRLAFLLLGMWSLYGAWEVTHPSFEQHET